MWKVGLEHVLCKGERGEVHYVVLTISVINTVSQKGCLLKKQFIQILVHDV